MKTLIELLVDWIKAGKRWPMLFLLLVPAFFELVKNYFDLGFQETLNHGLFIALATGAVLLTAVLQTAVTYGDRFRLSLFWNRPYWRNRGDVEWIAVANSVAWYPLRYTDLEGKPVRKPVARELAEVLKGYPFRVVVIPDKIIEKAEFAEDYYADACLVSGRIEGTTLDLKSQMILSEERIKKLFTHVESSRFDFELDELVLPVKFFITDPFLKSRFAVSFALKQSNTDFHAAAARLVLRHTAATALYYKDDPNAGRVFQSILDMIRLEVLPKPTNDEIARILFQVGYYQITRDRDKAMAALEMAIEYAPTDVDIHRTLAILYLVAGDDKRVQGILAAIDDAPLTNLILAANHARCSRWEDAIAEYEKVGGDDLRATVSGEDNEYFYSLLLIRIALTYGQSDLPDSEVSTKIIQYTEDVIQIRPTMVVAYTMQGFAWAMRGNSEKRATLFARARSFIQDSGDRHLCDYWEARSQDLLGEGTEAAQRLKDILGGDEWLQSDDVQTMLRLAQCLNRTEGGEIEAAQAADRALELEPDNGEAHFQKGLALVTQIGGMADVRSSEAIRFRGEARDALFKAIRLGEESVAASNLLGMLYRFDGDHVNAVRYFEDACGKDPAKGDWISLASALVESGNVKGALDRLSAARPHRQTDPGVPMMEGIVWQKLGDREQAKAAYERTLAMDETFENAHNNLAFLLFDADDHAGALQHWDRALEVDEPSADILAGRAIALRALGRAGEAAECYGEALAMDASFSDLALLRDEYMWSEKACNALKPLLPENGDVVAPG